MKTCPNCGFVEKQNTFAYEAEFELAWAKYPNKDGKKAAYSHWRCTVNTKMEIIVFNKALDNYLAHLINNKDWKHAKNGSTFFNNWQDWVNWQEPENGKPKPELSFNQPQQVSSVPKLSDTEAKRNREKIAERNLTNGNKFIKWV